MDTGFQPASIPTLRVFVRYLNGCVRTVAPQAHRVNAIPSPPLWQRAARAIGTAVGLVIGVGLLLVSFGAEVFDPWGENGLNLLDLLVGGYSSPQSSLPSVASSSSSGTSPTDVPRDLPPAGTGYPPDAAGAPPAQLNR